MDLGSIFLVLALLILVGLFVSRPLLERTETVGRLELKPNNYYQKSSLMADRDRILNALQELDFDHTIGKIPEEDYPRQRNYLVQRGADVFRQLDALQNAGLHKVADANVEEIVAKQRIDGNTLSKPSTNGIKPPRGINSPMTAPDDEIELLLAERRSTRQEKASGFCHKCGGPVQKSDRFCPKCGVNLR